MNTIPAPQTLDHLITEIECHVKHTPPCDSTRLLTDALTMLGTLRGIRDDVRDFLCNNPNTLSPDTSP